MKRTLTLSTLLFAGVLLAGCSTNGASNSPTVNQANLTADTLQFAVGTANIGQTGMVGLNTVVTFRQPSGASATLLNTPTITGPAGFVAPGGGTDAGTNHISGTPQQAAPGAPVTTFNQSGGAFSYGFAPFNSSTSGAARYPGSPALYAQPFYGATQLSYYGGPPAYPFFNDGTFPGGFLGYAQGFTMFDATPVAGAYVLSVLVPAANAAQQTFTSTGNLTNLVPLPSYVADPTFANTAGGGGTGVVTVPVDSRIVETLVYVLDTTSGNYYTAGPIRGTGPQTYTISNNLGSCGSPGCGTSNPKPTFAAGDGVSVYAASFDYPAFEAGPPGNTSPNPTITGANGQADITTSPGTAAFTY